MTSRRDVLAAVLLAAVAAACGRESSPGNKVRPTRLIHPPPIEATTYAVNGMTAFGAKLFDLVSDPTKNAVLSPFSIATAFGMARAGARGETEEQIDRVLGFPWNPHLALHRLADDIVTAKAIPPKSNAKRKPEDDPKPPVVAIANGLFAQAGIDVVKAFLDLVAEQYGAGVQRVDFTQPDRAMAFINAWVREQTADRIKKLFDDLDPTTLLVLANAVYLKADWTVPMLPMSDQPFRRSAGTVPVPTMFSRDERRYAEGPGWQAGELTYFGGELAMWVVVPRGDAAPASLLTPDVLDTISSKLKKAQVDLTMPRWDFATDLDLVPPLRELGMEVPFTPEADFSGMLPGVMIDQVVHRANITVDEWGTEAAAVTGISAVPVSAPAPGIPLRADHPFAFAIMHLPTKTPLFLGQVVDPTAKDA
ncbi:serpin family protein [Tenggerimyces flavus]|uniref:Serpin family protein n=1 Tax=Tenggerimyces flavus TaxID=1708749 RepID=A0ABV7YGB4_9ACTN|nr:serpin family protein [Tenggerimyces flavus]MBM7785968.1 serpin B [Tenggerimyces flavus]